MNISIKSLLKTLRKLDFKKFLIKILKRLIIMKKIIKVLMIYNITKIKMKFVKNKIII